MAGICCQMSGGLEMAGTGGRSWDPLLRPLPPPPPRQPFAEDGWDSSDPDVHIECLMPNGIVVPLDVRKGETLENIKQASPC